MFSDLLLQIQEQKALGSGWPHFFLFILIAGHISQQGKKMKMLNHWFYQRQKRKLALMFPVSSLLELKLSQWKLLIKITDLIKIHFCFYF